MSGESAIEKDAVRRDTRVGTTIATDETDSQRTDGTVDEWHVPDDHSPLTDGQTNARNVEQYRENVSRRVEIIPVALDSSSSSSSRSTVMRTPMDDNKRRGQWRHAVENNGVQCSMLRAS